MAKLNIQQETFDNYVQENINDLGKSFKISNFFGNFCHSFFCIWELFFEILNFFEIYSAYSVL